MDVEESISSKKKKPKQRIQKIKSHTHGRPLSLVSLFATILSAVQILSLVYVEGSFHTSHALPPPLLFFFLFSVTTITRHRGLVIHTSPSVEGFNEAFQCFLFSYRH